LNQTKILAALKTIPLFEELDEASLHEVVRLTRHRAYPANSVLFHDGDSGHILYIILSGQVHLEKVSAAGETVYLAGRGRGDHFGELSLLDGGPRMATACTLTACECLTVEREAFQRCLLNAPAVALQVMVSLAKRLREAAADLEAVQGLDVMGRMCKALLELLAASSGEADPEAGSADSGAGVVLQITHQELADRIGTTRESVTRALGSLRKTGLVRTNGRTLILLDLAALRRRCAL
jgi:CRP/FNR family cyclic AMP-dependent transcriptional regulator